MIGPDRSVHGGISAVVNSYFDAGLDTKVNIRYIGTMKDGSKFKKLFVAAKAYAVFIRCLPYADIIHIHTASDISFWRKSIFIKTANKYMYVKRSSQTGSGSIKGDHITAPQKPAIIIHQHGGDFKNYHDNIVDDKKRARMDSILNMADRLLVLTPSWKKYFSGITEPSKIEVMPNGIIIPEAGKSWAAHPSPKDLCSAHIATQTSQIESVHNMNKILFLGRICADKGLNDLIDAVSVLRKEGYDLHIFLGGVFEEKSDSDRMLRRRIEENNEYIHLLGWMNGDEKNKAYTDCGIYALPSYYEGMPVSVLEAQSHGCIPIATNVGGIPEIITDRETGLLIKPHNPDMLAKAIREIIDDPKLQSDIRQKAYSYVCSNHSMEVILDKLIGIYSSLCP